MCVLSSAAAVVNTIKQEGDDGLFFRCFKVPVGGSSGESFSREDDGSL